MGGSWWQQGQKPLNRLLAQVQDSDDSLDDDDVLSPLTSTKLSPPQLFQQSQRSDFLTSQHHSHTKDTRHESAKKSTSTTATKVETSHQRSTSQKSKDSLQISKPHHKDQAPRKRDGEKPCDQEKVRDRAQRYGGEEGKQSSGHTVAPPSTDRDTAPNGEQLSMLLELQRQLMMMTDRNQLQRVVGVIEETGMFKMGDTSFDFDLCILDSNTVHRLKSCIQTV